MDQLRALRYFCKVVETGSFTKAAESFSVPASSLSRRIADLEKSLGANLLKRTTRVVQVTEIGRVYYEQVQDVLAQLASSDESVRAYQASPTGILRISTMVTFGEEILMPLLDEFKHRYPEIILDVSFSDELSTLSRDEVDIAIRGGEFRQCVSWITNLSQWRRQIIWCRTALPKRPPTCVRIMGCFFAHPTVHRLGCVRRMGSGLMCQARSFRSLTMPLGCAGRWR